MSRFIFLFLWCLASLNLSAQASLADESYKNESLSPSRLDKENWSKITKGVSYTPQKPKETPDFDPDINLPNPDFDINPPPAGTFEIFAKVLLWGLIGLVVVFVVARLITLGRIQNKNLNKDGEFSLEEIENNLMESDLERALKSALAQQDYRLAIRLYFLSLIKELAIKGHIHWKKDKTNGFYLSELYSTPFYPTFRRLTYAFEYAWYSGRQIESSHYQAIKPEFDQFLKQISK